MGKIKIASCCPVSRILGLPKGERKYLVFPPSEELKASRSLWELKVKGVQGSRKTGGGIVFIRSESGHRLLAGDALGKTSMLCSVV